MDKIKFYIYSIIYSQIKHTKLMTKNMRSPDDGFLGNIAKYLMINFNEFIINDSVKKLEIRKNDEVIEIGSGNGQAIEQILHLTKNKITSIEVSEKFRTQLIEKFSRFPHRNETLGRKSSKSELEFLKLPGSRF